MTSTALLLCLCWLTVANIGAFSPVISAVRQRKANLKQQRRPRSPSQESIMMCSSQGVDTCSRRYRVRACTGSEDYSAVIGLVDAWWGGRRMSPMLPRLFFDNFCDTTFMAVIRNEEAQKAGPQQAEAADTTQNRGTKLLWGSSVDSSPSLGPERRTRISSASTLLTEGRG